MPLPPLQEHFKLMAYCDDLKPSVSCMAEFKKTQEEIPLNYMVLSDSLDMVGVEMKATWVHHIQ